MTALDEPDTQEPGFSALYEPHVDGDGWRMTPRMASYLWSTRRRCRHDVPHDVLALAVSALRRRSLALHRRPPMESRTRCANRLALREGRWLHWCLYRGFVAAAVATDGRCSLSIATPTAASAATPKRIAKAAIRSSSPSRELTMPSRRTFDRRLSFLTTTIASNNKSPRPTATLAKSPRRTVDRSDDRSNAAATTRSLRSSNCEYTAPVVTPAARASSRSDPRALPPRNTLSTAATNFARVDRSGI